MAFNSTSNQLTFTVTGATGTSGYTDITVAKSLIKDITQVRVYIDGVQVQSFTTETTDSWLLHFIYQHSTHTIALSLGSETHPNFIETPNGLLAIGGVIAIIFVVSTVIALKRRKIFRQK